jgi:DNA/RNA endonuclease G (NUC1)
MTCRKIISISSAFSAGFGLSWYLFKNNTNETIDGNKAIFSTLINELTTLKAETPVNNNSIVPIKPGSKDTMSLNNSNRIGELMKHGYPSLDNLRIFEDYALSYDRRNRVPNWVFERLTPFSIKPSENVDRGRSEFKEDMQIHPYFRSKNQDYRGSGYDR